MLCRLLLASLTASLVAAPPGEWPAYGNTAGGTRFSALRQITKANVNQLKQVWEFHTGEAPTNKTAFEATPIFVDGTLYLSTPFNQVIALDPATGKERWRFNSKVDRAVNYSEITSRGVSYWTNGRGVGRILFGTIDARLISLDALTGKLDPAFGDNGQVDLTDGIDVLSRGDYQVTSPPAIVGDLVITGSAIGDNRATNVEQGIVRAFDVRTGKQVWAWDPFPSTKTGKDRTGAANAWGALSADPARDMVFVPTGSASPDFYGGQRPGDNRFANSVTALRASTGKVLWSFQVVHHDLWDYDVAAQPSLFLWKGKTPAVAVSTKMGFVFLLDRLTGKPLTPVEERTVPTSDIPGESASPTQPFPSTDALVPQSLSASPVQELDPADQAWCAKQVAAFRSEGIYAPPSLRGTVFFPGNVGGVNWGSAAIDEKLGVLVANTNRLATVVKLIPRSQLEGERRNTGHSRLGGEFGRQEGTPYAMYREVLMTPAKRLCNAPPWGTVTALNLTTGRKMWDSTLGNGPGTPNLGGPILTAGGLVFTAAAMDTALRAFEVASGKALWQAELPASAQATPMTFLWKGRQYVVVCAGGHGKLGTRQGDSVVAFALSGVSE